MRRKMLQRAYRMSSAKEMTARPGCDMEIHTYQKAQTISRVRNGMMKTYFVLWDSKLQFGGAGEKKKNR